MDSELASQRETKSLARMDFTSRAFDNTMSYLLGEDIVEKARKLKASKAFQQTLSRNFYRSDAVADDLVKAISQDREIARDLDQILNKGVDGDRSHAAELVAFVHSAERIPAFIDRHKVTAGGRVFRSKLDLFGLITYGVPVGIYLQGMVPAITMSILFTNRPTREPASIQSVLATQESKRRGIVRILETFKWFNAVAEESAGELYSREFAENCRIRLVHAHVRAAITRHQEDWLYQPPFGWNHDTLGRPLSAADGSIVVSTLVVTLLAMRRHLHKHVTDEEMDALNHWSNYVSFLQGVPEELLCESYEETAVQFAAFFMSMNTYSHHQQLKSFLEELQSLGLGQGLFLTAKPWGMLLDRLGAAALDQVFDADVKAHFGIKRATIGAKSLYTILTRIVSLMNLAASVSASVNTALDQQTVKLWRAVIPGAERVLSRLHGRVVG